MIFFHPASLSISFAFILEKHHLAIILSLLRRYLSLPFFAPRNLSWVQNSFQAQDISRPIGDQLSASLRFGAVLTEEKLQGEQNPNFHISALLFFTFQLSSYFCLILCLTVVCYQLRLPLCFHLHRSLLQRLSPFNSRQRPFSNCGRPKESSEFCGKTKHTIQTGFTSQNTNCLP